ncbi:hypothetical protein BOX37_05625 [Nocardia mangyaensis]|uniref:DUF4304 domain-containing protein n=1 Tax=Nocardia mangyaensis TaxID=2213200 RepID=A0A1J0VNG9_9NOCA|nr:hypothetical protein [Nocardia mangyaensis]APE33535.1 hypothetical protein BOX37_05625 [Nocardia mangyaensis]
MVGPDSALRRLTRDVGKLLQPYGFDGSEATWVRVAPGGVASVRRTRIVRTWTDGHQILRFGLGLAATPTAWWEFATWRNTTLGLPPTPLEQAIGPGLIDERALPADLTDPWSLRVDPTRAGNPALQADVDTIRADLPRRVHAYARRALRLLEPDGYLHELLADSNPTLGTREAIVVLLADHGPTAQLDEAIAALHTALAELDESTYAEEVIDYVRRRAALV